MRRGSKQVVSAAGTVMLLLVFAAVYSQDRGPGASAPMPGGPAPPLRLAQAGGPKPPPAAASPFEQAQQAVEAESLKDPDMRGAWLALADDKSKAIAFVEAARQDKQTQRVKELLKARGLDQKVPIANDEWIPLPLAKLNEQLAKAVEDDAGLQGCLVRRARYQPKYGQEQSERLILEGETVSQDQTAHITRKCQALLDQDPAWGQVQQRLGRPVKADGRWLDAVEQDARKAVRVRCVSDPRLHGAWLLEWGLVWRVDKPKRRYRARLIVDADRRLEQKKLLENDAGDALKKAFGPDNSEPLVPIDGGEDAPQRVYVLPLQQLITALREEIKSDEALKDVAIRGAHYVQAGRRLVLMMNSTVATVQQQQTLVDKCNQLMTKGQDNPWQRFQSEAETPLSVVAPPFYSLVAALNGQMRRDSRMQGCLARRARYLPPSGPAAPARLVLEGEVATEDLLAAVKTMCQPLLQQLGPAWQRVEKELGHAIRFEEQQLELFDPNPDRDYRAEVRYECQSGPDRHGSWLLEMRLSPENNDAPGAKKYRLKLIVDSDQAQGQSDSILNKFNQRNLDGKLKHAHLSLLEGSQRHSLPMKNLLERLRHEINRPDSKLTRVDVKGAFYAPAGPGLALQLDAAVTSFKDREQIIQACRGLMDRDPRWRDVERAADIKLYVTLEPCQSASAAQVNTLDRLAPEFRHNPALRGCWGRWELTYKPSALGPGNEFSPELGSYDVIFGKAVEAAGPDRSADQEKALTALLSSKLDRPFTIVKNVPLPTAALVKKVSETAVANREELVRSFVDRAVLLSKGGNGQPQGSPAGKCPTQKKVEAKKAAAKVVFENVPLVLRVVLQGELLAPNGDALSQGKDQLALQAIVDKAGDSIGDDPGWKDVEKALGVQIEVSGDELDVIDTKRAAVMNACGTDADLFGAFPFRWNKDFSGTLNSSYRPRIVVDAAVAGRVRGALEARIQAAVGKDQQGRGPVLEPPIEAPLSETLEKFQREIKTGARLEGVFLRRAHFASGKNGGVAVVLDGDVRQAEQIPALVEGFQKLIDEGAWRKVMEATGVNFEADGRKLDPGSPARDRLQGRLGLAPPGEGKQEDVDGKKLATFPVFFQPNMPLNYFVVEWGRDSVAKKYNIKVIVDEPSTKTDDEIKKELENLKLEAGFTVNVVKLYRLPRVSLVAGLNARIKKEKIEENGAPVDVADAAYHKTLGATVLALDAKVRSFTFRKKMIDLCRELMNANPVWRQVEKETGTPFLVIVEPRGAEALQETAERTIKKDVRMDDQLLGAWAQWERKRSEGGALMSHYDVTILVESAQAARQEALLDGRLRLLLERPYRIVRRAPLPLFALLAELREAAKDPELPGVFGCSIKRLHYGEGGASPGPLQIVLNGEVKQESQVKPLVELCHILMNDDPVWKNAETTLGGPAPRAIRPAGQRLDAGDPLRDEIRGNCTTDNTLKGVWIDEWGPHPPPPDDPAKFEIRLVVDSDAQRAEAQEGSLKKLLVDGKIQHEIVARYPLPLKQLSSDLKRHVAATKGFEEFELHEYAYFQQRPLGVALVFDAAVPNVQVRDAFLHKCRELMAADPVWRRFSLQADTPLAVEVNAVLSQRMLLAQKLIREEVRLTRSLHGLWPRWRPQKDDDGIISQYVVDLVVDPACAPRQEKEISGRFEALFDRPFVISRRHALPLGDTLDRVSRLIEHAPFYDGCLVETGYYTAQSDDADSPVNLHLLGRVAQENSNQQKENLQRDVIVPYLKAHPKWTAYLSQRFPGDAGAFPDTGRLQPVAPVVERGLKHFVEGRQYFRRRRFSDARFAFRHAALEWPDALSIRYWSVATDIRQGRLKDAYIGLRGILDRYNDGDFSERERRQVLATLAPYQGELRILLIELENRAKFNLGLGAKLEEYMRKAAPAMEAGGD